MADSGETDLERLLATMAPRLDPTPYVYVSIDDGSYGEHADLAPIASCLEAEGLSLVIAEALARVHGFEASVPLRRITLNVHSSLEAVGLTAAVARALADENIAANVVAGFHHDHVFVPEADAERALALLETLSASARP